jgi:hypothetical protein
MPSRNPDDSRSAAQRRADFERFQQLRLQAQARMAELCEIWRDCKRKPCRRGKRCTGPSVATCLSDWWSANIDDDTRTILHAAVKARVAGASVEEAYEAADRMEARIATERAALAAGRSWHETALAQPAGEGPEPAASAAAAPPAGESEASRAAVIRSLRADDRLPRGVAHWTR